MDQLLANVNYLIREKLWCSIRDLCDSVSQFLQFFNHHVFIGTKQRLRRYHDILEIIRYFQRRRRNWGNQRTQQGTGQEGVCIRCSYSADFLPWTMQKHRPGVNWHLYPHSRRERGEREWQRSDMLRNFPVAHPVAQESRPDRQQGHREQSRQLNRSDPEGLDLLRNWKRWSSAEGLGILWVSPRRETGWQS